MKNAHVWGAICDKLKGEHIPTSDRNAVLGLVPVVGSLSRRVRGPTWSIVSMSVARVLL